MPKYLRKKGTDELVIHTEVLAKHPKMEEISEGDAKKILKGDTGKKAAKKETGPTRWLTKRGTSEVVIRTDVLAERTDMVEVTEKDAKALIAGDTLEPDEEELSVETRAILIREAIDKLDPIEGWTKGGKDKPGSLPNAIILSEALGFDVKAAERNDVMSSMEADK